VRLQIPEGLPKHAIEWTHGPHAGVRQGRITPLFMKGSATRHWHDASPTDVTVSTALKLGVAVLLAATGCGGGGDQGTSGPPITDGTGGGNGGADTSTPDPSGFDDSDWEGTAFEGEIHGLLQFTFSPGHALRADDEVGLVGGYRTSEVSWDIEDLYSPVVYGLPFPAAPTVVDSTAVDAMLEFDYGSTDDWVTAGNGMRVRHPENGGTITACRREISTVEAGPFPIYATGAGIEAQCNPDATLWEPGIEYDLVLFGGDAFGDNELLTRVATPPVLEVTSPDLAALDAVISAGSDLSFAWNASTVESRITIRIIDDVGGVVSAHAADDGEFSIPAGDLAMLAPGPIDIVIARERVDRMLFTDGGISVVSRFERWGFFQLGE